MTRDKLIQKAKGRIRNYAQDIQRSDEDEADEEKVQSSPDSLKQKRSLTPDDNLRRPSPYQKRLPNRNLVKLGASVRSQSSSPEADKLKNYAKK